VEIQRVPYRCAQHRPSTCELNVVWNEKVGRGMAHI
jgi:hypothetical protein